MYHSEPATDTQYPEYVERAVTRLTGGSLIAKDGKTLASWRVFLRDLRPDEVKRGIEWAVDNWEKGWIKPATFRRAATGYAGGQNQAANLPLDDWQQGVSPDGYDYAYHSRMPQDCQPIPGEWQDRRQGIVREFIQNRKYGSVRGALDAVIADHTSPEGQL